MVPTMIQTFGMIHTVSNQVQNHKFSDLLCNLHIYTHNAVLINRDSEYDLF